jgi:hypothetical protein
MPMGRYTAVAEILEALPARLRSSNR